MIISRTPFRISFLGGGTDYPVWYREFGGEVLGAAIDKYCYISCRYLPPFFEHQFRIVYSKIENCETIDQIRHPAVREVLRLLKIDRGLEIHHDGDLPARSGIGSSSAFTVGLLNALHRLRAESKEAHELAMEAIEIERDILRETVGSQDQILASFGGVNHIQFGAQGDIQIVPLRLEASRLEEWRSHLMLFFTGVQRTAARIASHYVPRLRDQEEEVLRMKNLVRAGLEVLQGTGPLDEFGKILEESWKLKSSLSEKISTPGIEDALEAAKNAGATSGKILGAGGGGFLMLFAKPEHHQAIRSKLSKLLEVPFQFDFQGSQIIFCHEPWTPTRDAFCKIPRSYKMRDKTPLEVPS